MKGTADGPLLAVIGHIDEIGLIVHHIDDDGFLWFSGVGGWDPIILVGQRVEIATRDGVVHGVVGKKPIHLLKDDERKQVPELRHLHIDIGALRRRRRARARPDRRRRRDRRRAARVPERPPGLALDGQPARLLRRLEAARLVAEAGGAPGDVAGVAVTQEEITFAGARTTAYTLRPDIAIVVDVTFATDAPGSEEKELGSHKFGTGPVITRGSTLDPQVFELLHSAAEEAGIPFTVAASARYTGTDADAVHISRGGIPTGVVSVPLRYMHSPVEMVQLDDVENAAKLIAAFAQKLELGHVVPPLSLLLLWDIDGTLLLRATGEHAAALRRAAGAVHGVELDGVQVEAAGRTDAAIARDLLRRAGIADAAIDARADEVARAAVAAYEELCPPDLSAYVAPGVAEALDALAAEPERYRLALVTGNLEPVARRKLASAGIGHYFARRPGRVRLRRRESRASCPRSPGRAPAAGRASAPS